MVDQLSAQPKTYYYVLNLQGDVVKLVTESGAVAASYEYDAWGNILASSGSMAEKNPLRYRGYYYDSETGFYYLQSRYYDPATRRFINADVYASTDSSDAVSCNMFAYCCNNPVTRRDPAGMWWGEDLWGWLENTFGFAVYEANTYDAMEISNIFVGEEAGFATSGVIAGTNNKPVVFYIQAASRWWRVWEYGIGVTNNTKDGSSFSMTVQTTGGAVSWSHGNTATEIGVNLDKISHTTFVNYNRDNRTASYYHQQYIRTLPTAGALIAVGAALSAAVGAVAVIA